MPHALLSAPPVFSGVRVTRSLVLYACFVDRCLSFFFWPLCCLFFYDIRILIAPLVSSNSSFNCSLIVLSLFFFSENACEKGTHNCHKDAICISTRKSFTCKCKPGYYDDKKVCNGM